MISTYFFNSIFIGILLYYTLLVLWYSLLLMASGPEIINKFKAWRYGNFIEYLNQDRTIPVTVVTPAFNEEKRIVNMVYSVLNNDYKNVSLIIVNDGSTDQTMAVLKKEFSLHKITYVIKQSIKTSKVLNYYESLRFNNLMVIDKEHYTFSCPADAINAGLNACEAPLMMTVDADTILEPNAISHLLDTYFSVKNCIGVSGAIHVLNGNRVKDGVMLESNISSEFIPAIQSIEYLRSFLYGRTGWNAFGGALCFPGAFSLFETELLHQVGGYDPKNFSYDAEITTKLHHLMLKNHRPYRLVHNPNAFAWTMVPNTLKSFWIQRDRWQRGMLSTAAKHMSMLFNPKYKVVGLISFPAYILFEIFGPVIEFISYFLFILGLYLGVVSWNAFFWFIMLAWGYITFLSISMLFLDMMSFNTYKKKSDIIKMLWLVFVEMIWFRQFRAACCFSGTLRYFYNRLLGRPL